MTRRPGLLLVALLLLVVAVGGACAGDDDPVLTGPASLPSSTTASPGPAPAAQDPGPSAPPPDAPPPSGDAVTTTSVLPGTTSTVAPGEEVAPSLDRVPSVDDSGRVGSMGAALLSPAIPGAVIEVDATSGRKLTSRARDGLVGALRTYGGKDTIGFAGGGTVPDADTYSLADLRRLASEHRSTRSDGEAVSVYVLLLEGEYETPGVTGVAFGASSLALFPDTLGGGLLSGTAYPRYEQSVAVHELGHLFGLVDLTGQGAFHEDPDHPGHSASRSSVMFWAVEDVSIANLFRGGPPTAFDGDDRREMALIRGGE